MSAISTKYCHPTKQDIFAFVTHEGAFNNLKIYFGGKQVLHEIDPFTLKSGTSIKTDNDQTIDISLSSDGKKLSISVDGTEYYADQIKANRHDLRDTSRLFWLLAVLAIVGALAIQMIFKFELSNPILQFQLIYDIIFIAAYITAAALLSKGKAWAFFMGLTMFCISTSITTIFNNNIGWNLFSIAGIVVRIAIIIFLLTHIKNILRLMREGSTNESDNELLDNL